MHSRSILRIAFATFAVFAASCKTSTAPPPAPPARLSVAGAKVLDPEGNEIVLRGYNWGHWGTVEAGDALANREQGANSVRIPLRWWGEWKEGVDSRNEAHAGHIDEAHLAILDAAIHEATSEQLWVVLFVDSNYGQGADDRTDNFWTNPAMKAEFIEVWEFLVERYQNEPYIAAWEILPEPRPINADDDDVRAFYESVIPRIRAIDPRTPIIVGPNDAYSFHRIEAAYTPIDSQIIYTGNYFIFTHPLGHIEEIKAFQAAHAVPVWVNQIGVESGDDDAAAKARTTLDALNEIGIGWSWWTYRAETNNRDRHGIYYRDASDTGWILKEDWLALVGEIPALNRRTARGPLALWRDVARRA